MKVTLIALLITQLIALTGCYEAKVLSDTFSSAREVPITPDRIWDIREPDRKLLLVMVHGYNSSNDKAWGKFPEIIKAEKDKAFLGFNVLRYGYGSNACRNEVDISDRGDGLRSVLSDELKQYDGMIIMGHSIGGLVAMHGLIKLAKAHQRDLERIPVTVMTFGTPYSGVQGAELLGNMAFVCTDKQADAVTVFNRSLMELKVDWFSYFGNNEPKYQVTIKPFYGPADRLVFQDNACGPFPGCEQVVDGENHVMIVKPSDTNHSAYTKLRVQVDSMTDRIYGPNFAKRASFV
jgi:esterase/lipase superfamily enzyme